MNDAQANLYYSLSLSGVESVDLLARDIADDCASAEVRCFAWDTLRPDPDDPGSWLYRLTDPPKACSAQEAEELRVHTLLLHRAARYLVLRHLAELVERDGRTFLRILPGASA
jgi:hypothetical protein